MKPHEGKPHVVNGGIIEKIFTSRPESTQSSGKRSIDPQPDFSTLDGARITHIRLFHSGLPFQSVRNVFQRKKADMVFQQQPFPDAFHGTSLFRQTPAVPFPAGNDQKFFLPLPFCQFTAQFPFHGPVPAFHKTVKYGRIPLPSIRPENSCQTFFSRWEK